MIIQATFIELYSDLVAELLLSHSHMFVLLLISLCPFLFYSVPFASLSSASLFIHKSCLLVNIPQIINNKIYL